MARPSCLRLFWHCRRAAASRTFWTAGTSRPIRMAIMAITTNSSMRVNPPRRTRTVGLLPKDLGDWTTKGWPRRRPVPALRDGKIEPVRFVRLDLLDDVRIRVVRGRDPLLARGGAGPRAARLGVAAPGRAVAREDPDLVAAREQPLGSRDLVLPVQDGGPRLAPLAVQGLEIEDPLLQRPVLEEDLADHLLAHRPRGAAAAEQAKGQRTGRKQEGSCESAHGP